MAGSPRLFFLYFVGWVMAKRGKSQRGGKGKERKEEEEAAPSPSTHKRALSGSGTHKKTGAERKGGEHKKVGSGGNGSDTNEAGKTLTDLHKISDATPYFTRIPSSRHRAPARVSPPLERRLPSSSLYLPFPPGPDTLSGDGPPARALPDSASGLKVNLGSPPG